MSAFLLILCHFCLHKTHVPTLSDLFDSLDVDGREHEILAWIVKNNTEQKGCTFYTITKM